MSPPFCFYIMQINWYLTHSRHRVIMQFEVFNAMSLMLISDTHGATTAVMNTLIENKEITHVLHLGDMVRDAEDIEAAFPSVKVIKVVGNNDFWSRECEELLFDWGSIKIFACHGHRYGVCGSKGVLATRAKELGADMAVFGHTHIKFDESIDGVRLLNPSSRGYYIINNDGSYKYYDL